MIVWIASFPRSGNTFFRTLLHHLYGQSTYSIYEDTEIGAMDVAAQAQKPGTIEEMARDEKLYFVKTHFHPQDSNPAIYLMRDGRDSYVSMAHYLTRRHLEPRWFEPPVLRLIGKTYYLEILEYLIRTSSWSFHTTHWMKRTAGKTFLVRFEDLIREPERWIGEAFDALGLRLPKITDKALSFEFLHQRWPKFFRRGQVGSWRDEMPLESQHLFWRRHGYAMRQFLYLDGAPAPLQQTTRPQQWWPVETSWDRAFEGYPAADDSDSEPRTVSMSCLGRHGLWGNSVFQYMFLKSFARQYGFQCEVPTWLGQRLFGHADRPLERRHQAVLLDNMTLLSESANHIESPMDIMANRAASLTERGRRPYLLNQLNAANGAGELPFDHADLEGLFMIHTRQLVPFRDYLRDLLRPGPAVAAEMDRVRQMLRARGKTIIGIHVRRGDFDHLYSGQGYEFVTPNEWYHEWLEELWKRVDDPVLLVCTNSPRKVLPHFARYNPVTSASLGATMPSDLLTDMPVRWQRNADYFPDWYLLSQCDHLAISNSTFSFTAAMLNTRCSDFVRPNLVARSLVPFDPWDAQPVILLEQRGTAVGEFANRIQTATEALGRPALFPGIRTALKTYRRVITNRAVVAHRFLGKSGLARELCTPAFYLASRRYYGPGLSLSSDSD